jgi:hypothetical protein
MPSCCNYTPLGGLVQGSNRTLPGFYREGPNFLHALEVAVGGDNCKAMLYSGGSYPEVVVGEA